MDRCNGFINYLQDSGTAPLGFIDTFIVSGDEYEVDTVASDIQMVTNLYYQSEVSAHMIDYTPHLSDFYRMIDTQLSEQLDDGVLALLRNRAMYPNGLEIEVILHSPSINILIIMLEIRGRTFI